MKVSNSFFKNPIAAAALILILPFMAVGQQSVWVNASGGGAIEDAIIVYYPAGLKSFQKVAITNSKGKGVIESGTKVIFTISKIGFVTLQDTLLPNSSKTVTLLRDQVNLKDVVVTGQFQAKTTQQSVQQIRVIDRTRIEQQGAVSLRDVLTNELNIRLSQDGVLGSQMSMMGIGGQNIKILIDGVPVIGRMDGNIDISQLNLNNIERIEMIEGPMSVIYGTDALGGVINLITKKPSGKQYNVSVNSYIESVGTYNVDANGGFSYKNLSVAASGGRNYFDGFSTIKGDSIREQQWKPREQYFGDIQVSYKFKKQSHRLYSQGFTETIIKRNNPTITPYAITGFDNYFITNRWNYSLYSDFYFNNKATLNLINAYNTFERRSNTYIKNLVTGTKQLTPNPEDHDTTTFDLILLRATYTTHNTTIFNSQFGYDINHESGTGKRLENNKQAIGDYAAFYIAEIKLLDKLTLNQGLRAIYNTRYSAPVIPSFNIKYDVTKSLTIRGSYARGFRAPSLKELSLFFVDVNHNIKGNENLKAETSHNYLASVTHTKQFSNIELKTDASFFYNQINQMISLAAIDPTTQLYSYVNIDSYKTTGLNITNTFKYKNISTNIGMSYIGRYNQLSTEQNVPDFSYTPEYKANATYTFPKSKTDLSVFYKYNGMLPGYALSTQGEVSQTTVQAYQTLDLSATQSLWKNLLRLTVGVKNLTNTTSISYNTSASAHGSGSGNMPIAMGRLFFTSIKINIAKN